MNTVSQILTQRLQEQRTGLIVYITAGCPDYAATIAAVQAAAQAGADVIEIGLPFSDPMADGPIIQQAATRALQGGATTAGTLAAIREICQSTSVALAVMTYMNTVLQYGIEQFVQDFSRAGVSGLIIPDLPLEESEIVEPICRSYGVSFVRFLAPTSTGERIAAVAGKAEGFLYAVSSTGVTGVREMDYASIGEVIAQARCYTRTPIAIGFGIGSPAAACRAAAFGDAVIIGSALMEKLQTEGVEAVGEFIRSVRSALDGRIKQ